MLVYIWYVYSNLWQERGFTCCFVLFCYVSFDMDDWKSPCWWVNQQVSRTASMLLIIDSPSVWSSTGGIETTSIQGFSHRRGQVQVHHKWFSVTIECYKEYHWYNFIMETLPDHWRGQILYTSKIKTDLHPGHNLLFIFYELAKCLFSFQSVNSCFTVDFLDIRALELKQHPTPHPPTHTQKKTDTVFQSPCQLPVFYYTKHISPESTFWNFIHIPGRGFGICW